MKKWILFLLTFALLFVLPACKQPTPEEPAGYLIDRIPGEEYELTQANVETLEAALNDVTWTQGETKTACNYEFSWGDRKIQYSSLHGVVHDVLLERYCELSEEQRNALNEMIEAFGLDISQRYP